MAIRIITGNPGAGKTYFAVNHLVKNYCYYSKKSRSFRLKKDFTIITNIDDLNLKHISLEDALEKSKKTIETFFTDEYQKEISKKYKKIIYIIDEAQRFFHARFYNIDVFYYFQYHRHLGHDIYLITHQFDLIPKQIRSLAETETRAVNRSLSFLGEFKYNILIGKEIVDRALIKSKKSIFELYKSMDQEEVEKVKNPFKKIFALIGVMVLIASFFFYRIFVPKFGGKNKNPTVSGVVDVVNATEIPQVEHIESVKLSYIRLDSKVWVVDPLSNNLIELKNVPYKCKIVQNLGSFSIFANVPGFSGLRELLS